MVGKVSPVQVAWHRPSPGSGAGQQCLPQGKQRDDSTRSLHPDSDSVCVFRWCSMQLVKDLTEENSRLIRDNKQANASLDSMVKDNTDLTNRLFDIALQSPDDDGDPFEDAFADPAEVAERKEKRKLDAAASQATVAATPVAGRKPAMDAGMKRRQEETAAEVSTTACPADRCWSACRACTLPYLAAGLEALLLPQSVQQGSASAKCFRFQVKQQLQARQCIKHCSCV